MRQEILELRGRPQRQTLPTDERTDVQIISEPTGVGADRITPPANSTSYASAVAKSFAGPLKHLPRTRQQEIQKAVREFSYQRPSKASNRAEGESELRGVVLAGIKGAPHKEIRRFLRTAGFRNHEVPEFFHCARDKYYFLTESGYKEQFMNHAKQLGFRVIDNYDPNVPQDPAAEAELKEKLKNNAVRRWAGNILHSRSPKVRTFARTQCAAYGWETELTSVLEQMKNTPTPPPSQDRNEVGDKTDDISAPTTGMQIDEPSASPPIDIQC